MGARQRALEMIDCINGSNNSSPGPDGIPFALLRKFSYEMGPIIHGMIEWMAEGNPPPKNFNFGSLHLLPKNRSLLPKDTRPITIGNAVNRIIAKILSKIISPILDSFLNSRQKGFVEGRDGRDHITELVEGYYSSLSKKEQNFILFLDTKKAFDSLDHQFIYAVLEKIGIPKWFIEVYSQLLWNIWVFPILAKSREK